MLMDLQKIDRQIDRQLGQQTERLYGFTSNLLSKYDNYKHGNFSSWNQYFLLVIIYIQNDKRIKKERMRCYIRT